MPLDEMNNENQWFAQTLIQWQKDYGRHELPWQHTHDPYLIWISEIMLQQTQVVTVIPYFLRFIEKFPTVQSLAQASQDVVMQYWSGLGYYSRARNLHRCAQIITEEYNGLFPESAEQLETLPGIGRSTAAAISVFAFSQKEAILDGNVIRVFARIFGMAQEANTHIGKNIFFKQAVCLLPNAHLESYTQGLMDLGATVCTRTRPNCDICPFKQSCYAYSKNVISSFPAKKQIKQKPLKQAVFLVAYCGDFVLLEKRPNKGIWGGLYCFHEWPVNEGVSTDLANHYVTEYSKYLGDIKKIDAIEPFWHTFTHFKLKLCAYAVALTHVDLNECQYGQWIHISSIEEIGVPTPIKKILSDCKKTIFVAK